MAKYGLVGIIVTLMGSLFYLGGCQSMPKSEQTSLKKLAIHGHRGSRGTHPENSIPAFEEAARAGADVLEFDMQLTADDVVVISHDSVITGQHCKDARGLVVKKPIAIRSIPLAKVKTFDCGNIAQERFPEQRRIPKTRIPTLDEVLTWKAQHAPALEMNIETKMEAPEPRWVPDPQHFVTKILEILRKHNAVEKAILQSFDFRTLEVAKKLEPKLRLSCLFEKEKAFCEPTAKVGAAFASPFIALVTPEEVAKCHAQGIAVVPWTLNSEAEWQVALAAKVDGIITDYPRKLIHYLGEKKKDVAPAASR